MTATEDGISKDAELADRQDILDRFELVIGSCDYLHQLSKRDFMIQLFNDVFKLVPEAQKGSFYELVEDGYALVCSEGYDESLLSKLSVKVKDVFFGSELTTKRDIEAKQICIESLIDSGFDSETLEIFKELGIGKNYRSLYCPIKVGGANVGIMCLENFSNLEFSTTSVKTMKFYSQLISTYLTEKVNQDQLTQVHLETVSALISSIEVNDSYTEGHGKRVSFYAKHLAETLGLPRKTISDLETAGLLHDIGKLGIPTEILKKPGALTDEEYAIVRKHPENTRKILEKVNGLHTIREYAYCHHEHFDGNGYPRGLKADEIPYESQIISVADAFDAMTSNRAYRKALMPEEAAEIIRNQAGRQFHPELSHIAAKILPVLHGKMGGFHTCGSTGDWGGPEYINKTEISTASVC